MLSDVPRCGDRHPAGGWLCHEPVGHDGFHWRDGPGTEAWGGSPPWEFACVADNPDTLRNCPHSLYCYMCDDEETR